MCTTAAPASAASIADCAICSGVTGTCGLRPTVSPAPVMAQVMNALQFTDPPLSFGRKRYLGDQLVATLPPTAPTKGPETEGGDVDRRDSSPRPWGRGDRLGQPWPNPHRALSRRQLIIGGSS